jgi:Uma2 family endonuclease
MTLHIVHGADGLARRAFTAGDVSRMLEAGIMEEDEPFELVEGELVLMNAQGFAHDRIKTALTRKLGRFLPDDFFVGAEVSVQLSAKLIVQPDVVVGFERAVARTAEGFLTIPTGDILLLVEVATTSLSFDRGRKAVLYATHGIEEYWVIDTNRQVTWVHRRPQAEGFAEVAMVAADGELRPLASELSEFGLRLVDLVG